MRMPIIDPTNRRRDYVVVTCRCGYPAIFHVKQLLGLVEFRFICPACGTMLDAARVDGDMRRYVIREGSLAYNKDGPIICEGPE